MNEERIIPGREFMLKNGYEFSHYDAPFRFYTKGESVIGICIPCGHLMIDGKRIPRRFFGEQSIFGFLKNYLDEKEKKETSV